jgi:hypothetical protein
MAGEICRQDACATRAGNTGRAAKSRSNGTKCGSRLTARDRQAISRYKYRVRYTYEERHSPFTVGFLTTVPLYNRNQVLIAETEARHREAAASEFSSSRLRMVI